MLCILKIFNISIPSEAHELASPLWVQAHGFPHYSAMIIYNIARNNKHRMVQNQYGLNSNPQITLAIIIGLPRMHQYVHELYNFSNLNLYKVAIAIQLVFFELWTSYFFA